MRFSRSILLLASLSLLACNNENPSPDNTSGANTDSTQAPIPSQRPKSSLDSLDAIIAAEPNNLEALSERGFEKLQRNDQQGAWLDFQRAFNVDSTYPPLLLHLGELNMLRNQSREARNRWTQCANVDPENIDCRLNLVKLHASIQNFEPALKYANELIEIDEYFAPAYLYKGIIARDSRHDTDLALQYLQKATDLDQENVEALDLLAVTLASRGDTLAQYYYKRILAIEPNNAKIYYKLGVHYMNIDELNRAIEAYTKATQLNPNDADSFYNLGYIFTVKVKDYHEALDYYSKSIKANPNQNYKAHYGKGYAYEMLGDVINAKKEYLKTLELLPVHQPAKEGLQRIRN